MKKKISCINKSPEEPNKRLIEVILDSKEPQSVTLCLNGQSTFFCINTGAKVTVILERICTKIGSPDLKALDEMLKGPSGDLLACKGRFMGYLQKGDVTAKEEIYVIKNVYKPLLRRPAVKSLNFLKRVSSVKQEQSVLEQFSSMFEGLGKLEREYTQLSCRITQSHSS